MSQITTHILDTSIGRPARAVHINLQQPRDNGWETISSGITDEDGRVSGLLKQDQLLPKGIYRMEFHTGSYFQAKGLKSFYPYVHIVFDIQDEDHYHIPLLLNPYGYTTYRGS